MAVGYYTLTRAANPMVATTGVVAVVEAMSDTVAVTSVNRGTSTGGTFTITIDGQETSALDYDASDSTVETALEALSTVTAYTVTGSGTVADPWILTDADAASARVITGDGASLTGGDSTLTVTDTTKGVGTIDECTCLGVAEEADAGPVFQGAALAINEDGTEEVSLITVGDASSGNFTITIDGQTTGSIAYNAAASAVETAVEALSTVTAYTVTGSDGGPWTLTDADSPTVRAVSVTDVDLNDATGLLCTEVTPGVEGYSATATSIIYDSEADEDQIPTLFPFYATIDDEVVEVTADSGTAFTVKRARQGTVAALHLDDAVITIAAQRLRSPGKAVFRIVGDGVSTIANCITNLASDDSALLEAASGYPAVAGEAG